MRIGIASPISTAGFREFLYPESAARVTSLSTASAPAVTTLCKGLLQLGHEVVIFTLDPKCSESTILNGNRLTIYVAPECSHKRLQRAIDPLIFTNYRRISKLLKLYKEPLDVVSVHWTREYALAAKRYFNLCPVFVTIRDIIPYIISTQKLTIRSYQWWIIWLINELVMRNKGFNFIANSKYTAEMAKRYWSHETPIIANPIEDKFFSVKNTADFWSDSFTLTSISISNPEDKRKNIKTLLYAFKKLRAKFNVELNLIGGHFTKENNEIKKWQDEGLLNGVNLLGAKPHDEVLEILSSSHLMVHPSLEETFGNTLIEAMAVGCPALGGRESGAVPWVLDYGRHGYLCDVTSVADLAYSIEQILSNPNELRKKGEEAKDFCRKNYSAISIANKYIEIFQQGKNLK